ncbi:glucose-6-phosphate isomerase [Halobacteriales archaeon SW_7_68_16]|nr:MAG: glucose-6-phosphate isomerase [Halobacteriales archaeon SW_7_68_16]
MRVDIGNALATTASPGVARESLDRLDDRVARAHDRIERGRTDDEFGYAALDLPETATVEAIEDVAAQFDPGTVLVAGIGGSALGAATLGTALDPEADLVVLDNVDPAWVADRLDGRLDDAVLVVVSRSGTTTETLSNALVVREAMADAGVDPDDRTVVVTGSEGPLARMADRRDLPRLPVPGGVPGRFAVLSTVGLVPAALAGIDVRAILAGARGVDLVGSLYDCPAYAYGAVAYALAERGAMVNAVMPYAESLETFAEWTAQLWAESLGKDGLGQVPVRALGVTDQHSQLQLYRAGPRRTMVSFVRPRDRPALTIPESDDPDLAHLAGDLGDVIDAELRATEASLAAADRPSVRVELPRVDAASVGALLYTFEAACVLAGELYGIETFDQPAVEWGKRATRGVLGDEDTDEARTARAKTNLIVE